MRRTPFAFLAITVVVLTVTVTAQRGGGGGGNPGLPPLGQVASLRGVAPPRPDVSAYVRDPQALVVLGKALFWDTQVGSDGRTACGTCHFHAGADHRVTNTVASPANAATAFRPNATLTAADFPFHAFANPNNNGSPVVRDRRDVVGSAGLAARTFVAVTAGSAVDLGADSGGATPFTIDGTSVRQVTARNAPSVINAVFNVRNFWDGRASSVFTGPTPFGDADGRASVLVDRGGRLEAVRLRVDNASLASQAVGPPLNGVEMSFDGRAWAHLGTKLLALRPLARQQVAGDDSVLGPLADAGGTGLRDVTYASLVQAAFHEIYWASAVVVDADGRPIDGADAPRGDGEFTQAAYNFPLFVGLAIDAYEATLVADDTPVDRFLAGDAGALSAQEQAGLTEFRSAGAQCTQCHQGPEFTAAGVTTARNVLADPRAAGFFRTGVSAIEDDAGAAASDGFGRPLFVGPGAGGTAAGAFKSPGLRNVELTGPYFHTGGASTLEQVMEFYNRDGDVPAGGNLGPGMGQINLNGGERAQLVALMKALTDDRVRFERAPFDHPALCVPVGHVETNGVLQVDSAAGSRSAADRLALVPAVGRNGNDVPLQTFEELLAGVGVDGSRAHTLTQGCTP